jgi:hypothetical protein
MVIPMVVVCQEHRKLLPSGMFNKYFTSVVKLVFSGPVLMELVQHALLSEFAEHAISDSILLIYPY